MNQPQQLIANRADLPELRRFLDNLEEDILTGMQYGLTRAQAEKAVAERLLKNKHPKVTP